MVAPIIATGGKALAKRQAGDAAAKQATTQTKRTPAGLRTKAEHLPVRNSSSTTNIQTKRVSPESRGAQTKLRQSSYTQQATQEEAMSIRRRSQAQIDLPEKRSFPFVLFGFALLLDIIDIFAGFTYILSIILNIFVAIMVHIVISGRVKNIDKKFQRSLAQAGKQATQQQTKLFQQKMNKIQEAISSKKLKKTSQKRTFRFLIYGFIPFVQIFASWGFFILKFHKLENNAITEARKALESLKK